MQAERRVYLGVDLGATNCRVAIRTRRSRKRAP